MEMKLDEVDLMAAGLGEPPEEWTRGGILTELASVINSARRIVTEFRAHVAKMRASGDMTPKGMNDRLSQFARGELERLDTVAAGIVAKARKELAVFGARLDTVTAAPADTAARAMREIDIRHALLAMDEFARLRVLQEAVALGEEIVLTAVFGAPRFQQQQIAVPELLADVRRQWNERADPSAVSALRDLDDAMRRTVAAVKAARLLISGARELSEESRTTILEQLGKWAA